MSDETRKRIREVMDSLNFTPSGLMKGLREGRTGIIGVYIYSLESLHLNTGGGITARLLSGINSAGGQTGNNLLLYTGWEADYRKTPWEQFLNGHIDGLIWVDPFPGESTLSRLANAGLPVVAIFTHHVPDQIGYVNSDNTGGIVLAIEHLHSLGHRRIAYIGRSDTSNYMDRLIGYRQGLSSVGLPYDPSLEITGSDESWAADNTLIAVDTLLKVTNSPTAFVLPDDRSALRVVTHLENQNISVPDDVSVIGFDDIPDAENKILGGLTTIRQEFLEIGDNAVKLLMKLINGASVDDCRINVPTTLVVRNSTGKCKN
jgi:LacI family transcriptional regulator